MVSLVALDSCLFFCHKLHQMFKPSENKDAVNYAENMDAVNYAKETTAF